MYVTHCQSKLTMDYDQMKSAAHLC
jgi:hypothetical protein